MLRWLQRFTRSGRSPERRWRSSGLFLEALESRQLLSFASFQDRSGHIDIFAIGQDHQVYEQRFDTQGNLIGGIALTTAGAVTAMAATEAATASVENPLLFVIGFDNQVWEQKFDGNGNSEGSYQLTQPGAVRTIWAIPSNNGALLFVTGLDGQVWEQRFDQNGNSLGHYQLTRPGAVQSFQVVRGVGIFALGLDSQVWKQPIDDAGDSMAPYTLYRPGQVKAFAVAERDVGLTYHDADLYGIGLDNQVYVATQDAHGNPIYALYAPGQVLGLSAGQLIGIDSTSSQLFVVGLDRQLYTVYVVSGQPNHYSLTDPGQIQQVIPVNGWGRSFAFVIGLDSQIYYEVLDSNGHPITGYLPTYSGPVL
jgi:hypothetical protein